MSSDTKNLQIEYTDLEVVFEAVKSGFGSIQNVSEKTGFDYLKTALVLESLEKQNSIALKDDGEYRVKGLFEDAPVISVYSRKQALSDGVQLDISKIGNEAQASSGIKRFPVFMTQSVKSVIDQAVSSKRHCNDYEGVLWDILWMGFLAVRKQKAGESINKLNYSVIITGLGRKRYHWFTIEFGPIDFDNPKPCFTISVMKED